MVKKPFFVIAIVSGILLVYCLFIGFNISLPVAYLIFSISPFLLIWLAYTVIRFGVYKGKEFQADEEWGYGDRSKEDLDVL
jgi:hypothetical protein